MTRVKGGPRRPREDDNRSRRKRLTKDRCVRNYRFETLGERWTGWKFASRFFTDDGIYQSEEKTNSHRVSYLPGIQYFATFPGSLTASATRER